MPPKLAEVLLAGDKIEAVNVTEVAVEQIDAIEQLDLAVDVPASTLTEEPVVEEKTTGSAPSAEASFVLTHEEPTTISPQFEELDFVENSVCHQPSLSLSI